jgi:hypothetical protein
MKFARVTREVEHEIVPSLCDRAAELKKEIVAEFERYLDEHKFDGIPRAAIENWAVNEATKLGGDRRDWLRILRLITET